MFARYYSQNVRFNYWRGIKDHEVDVVAQIGDQIIPFEVKYRSQHTNVKALKGLLELCEKKNIAHGYVITKSLDDFGIMKNLPKSRTNIMQIPAPLFCYWIGESELKQTFGI